MESLLSKIGVAVVTFAAVSLAATILDTASKVNAIYDCLDKSDDDKEED